MNRWVLDTSVAVKWFSSVGEKELEQALRIRQEFIEKKIELVVPELFFIELGNALRFNPHFERDDVLKAIQSLWAMEFLRADLSSDVLRTAVTLAFKHDITLYDAVYVSLASHYDAPLVTADKKMINRIKPLVDILPLEAWPLN